jgi:Xaa-Pro aminopeptidase
MPANDIDIAQCRARQKRLLKEMERLGVELAIVTTVEHVQYLAGPRFGWVFSPAAALRADGHLTVVYPGKTPPAVMAADEAVGYDAQWHSTLRNDQRFASTEVLLKALAKRPKRVGVEFSACGPHVSYILDCDLVDIDPALYRLRRKKDPDELARLKKAIAATGKMYARAREMVKPGVNELEVFNELQSVAVKDLGEMLTGTGNDYASGEKGGPPRDRKAEAGELYILDLGPAYRGYFADNCRVISVDRQPTAAQLKAWEHVCQVFPLVQSTVRPGKSCKQLFDEVQVLMDQYEPGAFDHHLGHGIGLFPHETPHLNPNWDDTFEVGDVFTCEPGIYGGTLRAGIRLENDYLVTETGVELLSDFDLKLV